MPSPWRTGKGPTAAPRRPRVTERQPRSRTAPPDPRAFRNALGSFATGVTIITARGMRGELIGITANSFSSVSLDPPLVLFSLNRRALSWRDFLSTRHYAVNVLSRDQQALSDRFARASQDKWLDVDYDTWESGCPILPGCLANLECEYEHTHDGGDHIIFVGRVIRLHYDPDLSPLLFFRGRYSGVTTEE